MPPDSSLDCDLALIAQSAGPAFAKLDGARVLLTGGTGFVGKWLLRGLLAARASGFSIEAAVLTRDPAAFARAEPELAASVELARGDILQPLPRGERYDAVVHAAAETNVSGTRVGARDYHDVSLLGTYHVLDAATAGGASRFLYLSSGAVYGAAAYAAGAACEDDDVHAPSPPDTTAAYGTGKRAAEALVVAHAEQHRLDAVIARLFAFVGPGLPTNAGYAVGNFLADARAGRTIRVNGDGTAVRSYLYAAEMSVWLWTMLARGAPGRAYNVGSGDPISIAELAATVAHVAGAPGVEIAGVATPGARRSRYVPNVDRARDELGLRPQLSLADALRRTLDAG